MKTYVQVGVFSIFLGLAACGGSGDSSDEGASQNGSPGNNGGNAGGSGNTIVIADQDAYFLSLSKSMATNIESVQNALSGFGAIGLDTDVSLPVVSKPFNRFEKTTAGKTSAADLEADLVAFFEELDENGELVVTDNGLLFNPDPTEFCTTGLATVDSECLTLMEDISVLFTQISDTTGDVSVRFSSSEMMGFGFSETALSMRVSLTGIGEMARAASVEDVPENYTGAMEFTIAQTGPSTGSLNLAVTETIEIGSDDNLDFTLGATTDLITISGDEVSGESSLVMDVNALESVIDEIDAGRVPRFLLDDLELNITFSTAATETTDDDNVDIDVTLGGRGIVIEDELTKWLDVAPFELDAVWDNGGFIFQSNFVLNMLSASGFMGSTVEVAELEITAGSNIVASESCVDSGYVLQDGSATWEYEVNGSVVESDNLAANDCLPAELDVDALEGTL